VKAERRQRGELNRSSSLLDLTPSRKAANDDTRHSASVRLPNSFTKPVGDLQMEMKPSDVSNDETDAQTQRRKIRQRRVTVDVPASKHLPRKLVCSLLTFSLVIQNLNHTFVNN